MVLRLLPHNAEHWLANHLNAYLQDHDEYRAITRQTIIRGLARTITYTPGQITVELQRPDAPRVTRALALLIDEINHTTVRKMRLVVVQLLLATTANYGFVVLDDSAGGGDA